MIVFRYLSREIIITFLAVTVVLLLLFLSNQFVHHLGIAATGRLSGKILWDLMLIEVPHLLGLLMPLCFFLAILLAYGRLYVDGEMGAFIACGLDKLDLIKITLTTGLVISFFVGFLSLWVNPKILAYRDRLLAKEDTVTLLSSVLPGKFQQLPGSQDRVFYVEKTTRDKNIFENLFLAEQFPKKSEHQKESVLFAKRGTQIFDLKTHHLFLVLYDVYRYFGTPGEKEYQIMHFDSLGLRLDKQAVELAPLEQEAMTTWDLLKKTDDRNANLAELQWRISLPLSVLLLGLLAFSLCEVKPRQGRYAKLVPAVLIYTVYANLLFIGRTWIARGFLSPAIGMWWIHGLLILVIAFFLYGSYKPDSYSNLRKFFTRK